MHHKPTAKNGKLPPVALQFCKEQQKDTGRSSAFEATDCGECFQPDVIKGWMYGHTHTTEAHGSLVENGVPIFSNQVGCLSKDERRALLPKEKKEYFNGQFVFETEIETQLQGTLHINFLCDFLVPADSPWAGYFFLPIASVGFTFSVYS